MNTTGPGLLDPVGLAALTADVKSLVQDTDTGRSVQMAVASSSTVNVATGGVTIAEDSVNMTGWMAPLTFRELRESPEYQVGDVSILIILDDLGGLEPSKDMRLTIGAESFDVLSVAADPLNIHARLVCRRRA